MIPSGYHSVTPRIVVADVDGLVGVPAGRPSSVEGRDPFGNVFQIAHRR